MPQYMPSGHEVQGAGHNGDPAGSLLSRKYVLELILFYKNAKSR